MSTPAAGGAGTRPSKRQSAQRLASQSNRMALGTFAAVPLSIALSLGALTPVLTAAPLLPLFWGAMKRGAQRDAFQLTLRWGILLFVMITLGAIYLPDRTTASVPFAGAFIERTESWLAGTDSAPLAAPLMIAAICAGTALVSFISGGLGAIIIGAAALGCAACGFTWLLRHGENVIVMTLLGNLPWIVAAVTAGLFLLVPTALPLSAKFFGSQPDREPSGTFARTTAITAAALTVVAILGAVLLDDAWRSLLRDHTVF